MSKSRILVTGGAGYIGATAAAMLLDKGYAVTILDDLSTGFKKNIDPRARFVQGSLLEKGACHQALSEVETVFHFAAKSLVNESMSKPDIYWKNNVLGTRTLLDQMREFNVQKLVISSSAATYGEQSSSHIKESDLGEPTNPYGATKLAIDNMVLGEVHAYGIAAVSLRYFNVAGAYKLIDLNSKESKYIAELHNPETHLIPNIIKATKSEPIKIFGNDWPTPDGSCIRDYIHVEDLIESHIKAMENLENGKFEIYNLGSGTGYSVKQVINAAENVLKREIPKIEAERRAGDPAILISDINKAKEKLDWVPTKNLEDMVRDTYSALLAAGKI